MAQIASLAAVVQSLLTIVAFLVGGWWTYWRFVRQRDDCPKIEFNVDMKFVGIQNERCLIEATVIVKNKGLVRHRLSDFKLNVRYLLPEDRLVSGGQCINYQTDFTHSINSDEALKSRHVVPWNPFVDPGVTQPFVYITSIPSSATYVLLWTEFRYSNTRDSKRHLAQRVFKVPCFQHDKPKADTK